MHFCKGCNCGPGKCPGSIIRKEKKKVVKEGKVSLGSSPVFIKYISFTFRECKILY